MDLLLHYKEKEKSLFSRYLIPLFHCLAGLTPVPKVVLHPDHLYVDRSVPEHLPNLLSQHGHHPQETSLMTVMND